MKNKKLFKKISLFLAIAMILAMPMTSFAAWDTYGGNNNHNSVAQSAPTNPQSSSLTTPLELTKNGSGWDGVDNVPVLRTVGNTTYAYVLYDGYRVQGNNGGARLAKVNCNTKEEVWNIQVEPEAGFQLSTPLLVRGATEADDTLYIATSNAAQVLSPLNSPNWDISNAVVQGDSISIGNQEVVMTTRDFQLNENTTKRVALGIYLGRNPNIPVGAEVTWNVNGVTGSKSFSPADIMEDGNTRNYYFYLNENIGQVPSAVTNQITYTVRMIGPMQGTMSYAKLYDQGAAIQKVTNLDIESGPAVPVAQKITGIENISGQINTPITTDGEYIYFGTWQGGSNAGKYYQMKLSNNAVKTFTPNSYGFYWAGAVCDRSRVYFGSDDGKVYWRSRSNFSGSGGVLDLKTAANGASDAGNVRSTIMKDGDYFYFTSQGGYLWCCKRQGRNLVIDWKKKIVETGSVKSTSTPTKIGDRIYVGYYQGFSDGGVVCVKASENHDVKSVATGFPVQSSILVKGSGSGIDYVYFNTNSNNGTGKCYSFNGTSGSPVWTTNNATYALGGMACDNGYIVFGNDWNQLYIIK